MLSARKIGPGDKEVRAVIDGAEKRRPGNRLDAGCHHLVNEGGELATTSGQAMKQLLASAEPCSSRRSRW
jgi:hypothetical protein